MDAQDILTIVRDSLIRCGMKNPDVTLTVMQCGVYIFAAEPGKARDP